MTQAEIPSSSSDATPSDRPSSAAEPPRSLRPSQVGPVSSDMLHPRGRIRPPMPPSAPRRERLLRALVRLGQGLHFHGVFRAAPAMAFHFFLSLLPLLVFIGYVLGLVAQRKGVAAALGLLLDTLPPTAEAVVKNEVSHLASADRLGPLAAVGFLWVASGGVHGLMNAVEMVVGAPNRAWWKQRLFALGWVIATLSAVGVAAFGIIEWETLVKARPAVAVVDAIAPVGDEAEGARPERPDVAADAHAASSREGLSPRQARKLLRSGSERVLTLSLSLAGAVGGLCLFYRLAVSHAREVRRRLLPGALVAVALWLVVSWGFSLYLRTLASYTVYYGSLAAVAVLLVWLWLTSLAILVGAELNSQLEGLRDELRTDD
ncbi:MAG: YihY/virulence factor BrkB family protein [Labilithrix sp.]|nr:YihY/virulence factor BrkB family protein [Labilithrix sp.]